MRLEKITADHKKVSPPNVLDGETTSRETKRQGKVNSHTSHGEPTWPERIPSFCRMKHVKQLRLLLLPLDGMLNHRRVSPAVSSVPNPLYRKRWRLVHLPIVRGEQEP